MCHEHADVVAQLGADRSIAFELVELLALHAELLHLDLVDLGEVQQLDAVATLLFGLQVTAVDEGFANLLEAFHQSILLHGFDDHVRGELELIVVHEDDAIVRVHLLKPIEEIQECCDFRLCLDNLK